MQVSKNFVLQEFINPNIYAIHGEKSIDLIDKKLIDIAQFIRDKTGVSVTINTWHTGGHLKDCGLREQNSTTGAKKSQHKLGKAIDVHIGNWTGQQMNDWAKEHKKELFDLGVRQIESAALTTSWLHCSTKETGVNNGIQIIDLTKVVEVWQI